MKEDRYNIIFDGQIADRTSEERVRQELAASLKLNPETIDKFFSGSPFILIRNTDQKTAQQYLSSLEKAGALCRIVLDTQPIQHESGQILTQSPSDQSNSSNGLIICPKCGFEQPSSNECSKCGIIFSKYKLVEEGHSPEKPTAEEKPHNPNAKYGKIAAIIFVVLICCQFLSFIFDTIKHTFSDKTVSAPPISIQEPPPNHRLSDSTILEGSELNGHGKLNITNGLSSDAAVRLKSTGKNTCRAFFYVTSRRIFTLEGIQDGVYKLSFCTGEDWNSARRRFNRNVKCSEFDSNLDFKKYSRIDVTLNPVIGGNASTHRIGVGDFR